MKKEEMIQIDNSIITESNRLEYIEFYKTIFDTIHETYRCIYYIDGIKEISGEQYHCKSYTFEYFFKDIVELIRQKICNNIWKLLLDSGKDSLSIYRMKNFINNSFKCNVKVKSIKITAELKKQILGLRNSYISHNLHSNEHYILNIDELKPLITEIYLFFQNLWIKNFVDDSMFVGDGYFEGLKSLYKNSVKAALNGIELS